MIKEVAIFPKKRFAFKSLLNLEKIEEKK